VEHVSTAQKEVRIMDSKDCLTATINDLRIKVGILHAILLALKRESHTCCEDGYYSCPKDSDYFGPEDRNICNCGMDATNALIEATLEETK
jgi:hypothetical protein